MTRHSLLKALAALATASLLALPAYAQDTAGATPIKGDEVYRALHGKAGIDRIVANLRELHNADPRIADIFKGHDLDKLSLHLSEQICYLSGGPCRYTGRDMVTAHKDLGIQRTDFNALVEDLQKAMDKEGVPFRMQNKLLAKLAPMQRSVVQR